MTASDDYTSPTEFSCRGGGHPHIRRRTLIVLLGSAALLRPFAGAAQQPTKLLRIGFLATRLDTMAHLRDAFLERLRELGYVEGRNSLIEYADAEGDDDRLPGLAAELVARNVDVIVVPSTPAAKAAKRATSSVPIVLAWTVDPVGSGLVASLARPGGNVTGLSFLAPDLIGKRLELLKQAVPKIGRIAVLWHPGDYGEATERDMLQRASAAAQSLGVQLQVFAAENAPRISSAPSRK
jgi:putative tryptophan/tyrosine transport system substrate-binding protein